MKIRRLKGKSRGSACISGYVNIKSNSSVIRARLTDGYQLVNQEKEKENNEILKAIIQLGERGLLEPEIAKDTAES